VAPTLTGGIVDHIQGAIAVIGDSQDIMNVDDTGSTAAKSGTLTSTALTGLTWSPAASPTWAQDAEHQPRLGRQHFPDPEHRLGTTTN